MASAEQESFAAFYLRTSRPLWAYVRRATGNAADADDIVQDAFCRLASADVSSLDDEEKRRYLFRIATNLMTDRWRRSAREQSWLTLAGHALRRSADPAPLDEENVGAVFDRLPPRERALLWLAYVEEEDHRSIAASLGVAVGSVKVLLFRARGRLRALLKASSMIGGRRD